MRINYSLAYMKKLSNWKAFQSSPGSERELSTGTAEHSSLIMS